VKQLRRFRIAAFTLVLLSIVGFCTAQRSAGLLLAAGAIAALSWYVTEGPRGRTLPRWTSNVLVFAVLANTLVDLLGNMHDPLSVLGRFQIWLILIKLYERKTARDYSILLTLSVILMITACTEGQNLLFGIVLVLYAVLGFHVLLSYQLYAGLERAQNERKAAAPAGYRLVPPVRPVTGRVMQGQMRWLLLMVGSFVFLLSALLFVAMPRSAVAAQFGERALGLLVADEEASVRSGFSSRLDLRNSSRVLESRKPVLTMQLTDAAGRPYHSAEPLRLRATVMERSRRNDPSAWVTSSSESSPIREIDYVGRSVLTLAQPDESERIVTQHVSLLKRAEYIFALYAPVSYSTSRSHEVSYFPRMQVLATPGSARVTEYTVRSAIDPTRETLEQLHNGIEPRMSTRWRYQNSAVRQLAISLLHDAGLQPFRPGDEASAWEWNKKAADVFQKHLQSEHFTYTTDLSDVPPADPDSASSRDPIVRFLFETRRGYCGHFASAMVALCQSVQIHARIATGFIAYEYDGTLQHYIVRESNAHAWTEVRTGDFVWTTFDPTPAATISSLHTAQHTFADRLQLMYDGLEFQWDNGVVGFDHQAQAQLRDWFSSLADTLIVSRWLSLREQAGRFTRSFIFDFGFTGALWMAIVGLALVLAFYTLFRLMRRTRRLRRSLHIQHLRGREYRVMLRQLGFYLDMLRMLRKRGWAKPEWKTPLQLADELEQRHPAAAQLVRQVTNTFYAVRFGGHALEQAEVQRAHAMISELEKQL
jgi:hypothetical protein